MPHNERVVQNLNRALRTLLERDDELYILGEDIVDPYGGAFGVTKGLSSAFPDRVIATPISENAMVGVANGLTLCGNKVIVEIMFGDFIGLAFDQILNFTSKATAMYGEAVPMPIVVRCPVGGRRGYGPTHSQSVQKHFMGIPQLSLYEISPFHDAELLLAGILEKQSPAILFEPKDLYPERVFREGKIDDLFTFEFLPGGEWVHVWPSGTLGRDLAIFATGGMVGRAIEAGRRLTAEDDVRAHILVPSRLYPLDLGPVMDLLTDMTALCVVEESSPGGTWGSEVARYVDERMWGRLANPVLVLNSRDCVIPAAPHLEEKVLAGSGTICSAVRSLLRRPGPPRDQQTYVSVTVPKFNSNDTAYLLLDWLARDGEGVREGSAIAEIETSKAVEELIAPASGLIMHEYAPGKEFRPGECIGRIMTGGRPGVPMTGIGGNGTERPAADTSGAGRTRKLSWNQRAVAEAVSASHREIPDAFVVLRAEIDAVLRLRLSTPEGAPEAVGLLETIVVAVASLEKEYPAFFGGLMDAETACLPDGAHIGVTFDAGNGLFIPVVRSAERRDALEIADMLAGFRLQAVRGHFTSDQLADPNIVISWNYDAGVTLVKAIIPSGLACVISVGGPRNELNLGKSGHPLEKTVVSLGLTHDHRIINGREAIAFLQEIAVILSDEKRLTKLLTGLRANFR